eukprot:700301-Pelagomonas_calceolata.AAC.1
MPRIFTAIDFCYVDMAASDVQSMKFLGWSCAAPNLFVTSHAVEYSLARGDQDSIGAAGVAPSLIRNAEFKEGSSSGHC